MSRAAATPRVDVPIYWLTGGVLFVLYLNAAVVAVRIHGAPFALAAIVPLALALPAAYNVIVRGEELRFPRMLLAALALLCVQTLSALASVRPLDSLPEVQTWLLEGVVLAFLVVNAVRSREDLRAAVAAIVLAGAVMGAIAIAQQWLQRGGDLTTMWGFGQLDAAISDGSGGAELRRLAGPIGETNRFAQIMAVLIPIGGCCALTSRGRTRWLWSVATALIAAGMLFAFSRGAVVALALAIPFAIVFRVLQPRHVVATLLLAVCVLAASPHYAKRVATIGEVALSAVGFSPGGLRNADSAARGRVTEMQAAGLLFLDHPILGAGPGLAPHHYPRYARLVGGKVRAGTRRSHNLFLQLAAETGVLGLGAFLAVLGFTFADLERARRRLAPHDRGLWGLVCGIELALIVSLTTSLFLHAAYIRYFWLLLGLAGAASAVHETPILVRVMQRMLGRAAQQIRAGT